MIDYEVAKTTLVAIARMRVSEWFIERAGRDGLAGLCVPNLYSDKRKPIRISVPDMGRLIGEGLIQYDHEHCVFRATKKQPPPATGEEG